MKTCTKCGQSKPESEFYKDVQKSDGLSSACKGCIKSKVKRYYAENKDKVKAYVAAWQKENKENVNTNSRKYRTANPGKRRESVAKYVRSNLIKVLAAKKKWKLENPEKARQVWVNWNAKNPDLRRMISANYRASKLNATPEWVDVSQLNWVYVLAQLLTELTGIDYEVDHIVPLQNPIVCGLHVSANLQVIQRVQNRCKSNMYWPDMP